MTNGDRIRQMKDEELGDFLNAITDCCGNLCDCENCQCYYPTESYKCNIQEWLKQEAKDDAEH